MNIVVLVKQVPDTYSERRLSPSEATLDRDGTDAVLDEIDERAVEAALQLKEAHGGEVSVVAMGQDRATDAIRKALSMGADKAVHLSDEAVHGSCAVQTAQALAKVLGTVEGGFDLVVAGNEASDGRSAAVPAMVVAPARPLRSDTQEPVHATDALRHGDCPADPAQRDRGRQSADACADVDRRTCRSPIGITPAG